LQQRRSKSSDVITSDLLQKPFTSEHEDSIDPTTNAVIEDGSEPVDILAEQPKSILRDYQRSYSSSNSEGQEPLWSVQESPTTSASAFGT
jgi:hypothetical protein